VLRGFLLSLRLPSLALYALVAVAGACTIGTTILVNAYTVNYYPARARATGLGWALAVGRLGVIVGPMYGGLVLASKLGRFRPRPHGHHEATAGAVYVVSLTVARET
jgi:MFS family permease